MINFKQILQFHWSQNIFLKLESEFDEQAWI